MKINVRGKDKSTIKSKAKATEIILEELDLNLNNRWLIKRKALATTGRILQNLKFGFDNYLRQLVILKYFYPPGKWWDFVKPTKNTSSPFILFPASF